MELCEVESPFENGEIELDESYFGVGRVRGKRGRGAGGKIPVFGILKKETKFTLKSLKVVQQSRSYCLLLKVKPPYRRSQSKRLFQIQ